MKYKKIINRITYRPMVAMGMLYFITLNCTTVNSLDPESSKDRLQKGATNLDGFSHQDMADLKDYVGNWDLYSANDFLEDILHHTRQVGQRKTKQGAVSLVIPKKVTFKDGTGKTMKEDLMTSFLNKEGKKQSGTLKDIFEDFLIKKGIHFRKGKPKKDTRLFVVVAYMNLAQQINKALHTASPKQEVISQLKAALNDFKLKIANHVADGSTGINLHIEPDVKTTAAEGGMQFVKLDVKTKDATLTKELSDRINEVSATIDKKITELEAKANK